MCGRGRLARGFCCCFTHGNRSQNRRSQDCLDQSGNGRSVRRIRCASEAEVHAAVARASSAQPSWADSGCAKANRDPAQLPTPSASEKIRSRATRDSRSRQTLRRSAAHGSAGSARRRTLPDRQRVPPAARRTRPPRQSGDEDQVGPPGSRALWRDRHHLTLELSLLDSGDGEPGRAGGWKRGSREALGVYFAHRLRTGVACCTKRACRKDSFSGHPGRRRDGSGA